MPNAQVLYNEVTAATTSATTTWVDLAIIPASSFIANKTYLILANQVGFPANASAEFRVRLVRGTTPTLFTDAGLAWEGGPAFEHEESYMLTYTQPATAELVKLQFSSSSTVVMTNILSQILAIKLDDDLVSGTDYFYNEFTTDYTLTNTPTAKAITASFTPNGSDRWLYIGNMIDDCGGTITTPKGFELYDSVAGILNSVQQEGEDATNDFHGHNLYWVGVPTNAARTLAVRPFQSGATPDTIQLSSRVIAINLSKVFLESASAFSATEVQPAATPTFSTVATIAPNPTNTGDWAVIAFSTNDVGGTATDSETRLQINPGGGGLADDPPYTNTAPGNDVQDATDETAFSVFNLVSLTSGAGRTINWDVRAAAGTTQRFEDNGVVAFSVALAKSAAITGTITSGVTETDIVAGGKTLIITLTNATWIAAGAASFDLQRDEIIAGVDSAQSETFGWDLVPKALQSLGGVVRTSDTVVTITWDAFSTYNITAMETITVTVPSTAIVEAVTIVATPTFTITTAGSATFLKDMIGALGIVPIKR